jgi:hypothetical protein
MTHMSAKRIFERAFIVVVVMMLLLIVACGGGSGGDGGSSSGGGGGSDVPIPLPPFEVQVVISGVQTPDCSDFSVFFNVVADNTLILEDLEDDVSLVLNGDPVDDFAYSPGNYSMDDPFSSVFVMDYSRSMPPDAIEAMEQAVIAFLQNDLKPGDYAHIIKFANQTLPFSEGIVAVETNLDDLIAFVQDDTLPPMVGTDIYGAANEAVDSLIAQPLTDQRAVIFLTDGEQNPPAPGSILDAVILKAREAGIPFYTIGLMVEAFDETDIKRMARETGGFFFRTEVNQLAVKYDEIRDALFSSNHIITFETSEPVSTIAVGVTYDGKTGSDQVTLTGCP